MTKTCSVCKKEKPFTEFHKNKTLKDGHNSSCKVCVSVKQKSLYKKIKDDPKKLNRRKKLTSDYQKRNKHRRNANLAKYRSAKINATPVWLSGPQLAQIQRTYKLREIITDATGEEYHVDHIIPLRGENVCGLHVPWNLQVIPAVDNLSKNNRYEP